MRARRPHYFLRTQAAAPPAVPRWAFSLQAGDESPPITAGDLEPNASWERLQLLAVVRGLEALSEPALVTLATASDVVRRGIRHGLEEWREFDWQLEHFGELIPVKNADLWKRIDRALAIHDVQIRHVRVDDPIVAEQIEEPHFVHESAKSRRAQTAFAGSKLSRSAIPHAHECTPGSLEPSTAWFNETTTRNQGWDTGSKWHDAEDIEDSFLDEEGYDYNAAQKAGNIIRKQSAARNNRSVRKSDLGQKKSSKRLLGLPFYLLRTKRRLKASRLHIHRRVIELWNSWLWFFEVTGLRQLVPTRKQLPRPWLRDQQQ